MKTIEGYNNLYSILEDGRILSNYTGNYLKPFKDTRGYLRVTLYKEGRGKTFLYHRLYAIAYLPSDDYTLSVNHKDGDKLNNRLDNLEWMSLSDNVKHAYSRGLNTSKGEMNNNSKLSDEDCRKIKSSELTNRELANEYSVHITTIQKIRKGKLRSSTNDT